MSELDLDAQSREASATVYSPAYPFDSERLAFEHGWRSGFDDAIRSAHELLIEVGQHTLAARLRDEFGLAIEVAS